ncbi:hypothetical protein BC793_111293 [Actinoplanes xinjiangensis]|uniref:Uncharacterized protein n=2 Tax=Actinoplanes xinjiangensis TaxID=512350 RepID=A0A316FCV7_9ACTN|nr:hypothetical protein BC793_111293 [Actinoplanes xinjiangensis]
MVSERGPRPLSSHVNGQVCATCNNGWMSSLDAGAQRVLLGSTSTGVIAADTAEVLARWLIKVVVNLNVTQPYRLLVPEEDRHGLAYGIPASFAVDLFRVRQQNGLVDWVQGFCGGLVMPIGMSIETQTSIAERTLVTHVRIADIVAVVVRLPYPMTVGHLPPADEIPRLWPLTATPLAWQALPVHDRYDSTMRVLRYTAPPSVFGEGIYRSF